MPDVGYQDASLGTEKSWYLKSALTYASAPWAIAWDKAKLPAPPKTATVPTLRPVGAE